MPNCFCEHIIWNWDKSCIFAPLKFNYQIIINQKHQLWKSYPTE